MAVLSQSTASSLQHKVPFFHLWEEEEEEEERTLKMPRMIQMSVAKAKSPSFPSFPLLFPAYLGHSVLASNHWLRPD